MPSLLFRGRGEEEEREKHGHVGSSGLYRIILLQKRKKKRGRGDHVSDRADTPFSFFQKKGEKEKGGGKG